MLDRQRSLRDEYIELIGTPVSIETSDSSNRDFYGDFIEYGGSTYLDTKMVINWPDRYSQRGDSASFEEEPAIEALAKFADDIKKSSLGKVHFINSHKKLVTRTFEVTSIYEVFEGESIGKTIKITPHRRGGDKD